jgi:hypothetical protein
LVKGLVRVWLRQELGGARLAEAAAGLSLWIDADSATPLSLQVDFEAFAVL